MAGAQSSSGPGCLLRSLSNLGVGGVSQGALPSVLGLWLGRQLRKWELERQKAQVLQESYKLEQPPFEQLDATTQTLQAEPEHPEEAKGPEEEEEEEKEVSGPHPGPGVLEVQVECTPSQG